MKKKIFSSFSIPNKPRLVPVTDKPVMNNMISNTNEANDNLGDSPDKKLFNVVKNENK
jgi:hypothetical protein